MNELDKRFKDTGKIGIESKEGERRRLSSHSVGTRSPSLGDDQDQYLLSDEAISALTNLGEVLRRIHIRLRRDGQVIDMPQEIKKHENGNCEN